VSCAESVVASVCSVCTFLSSSLVYLIFLSLDLAADCRFARILRDGDQPTPSSNLIINHASIAQRTPQNRKNKGDMDLQFFLPNQHQEQGKLS
jgi:hypothetical protein